MATTHAHQGEIVEVQPWGAALTSHTTRTLFKTPNVEIIRMVMRAGSELPEHAAPGEVVVQCLEGCIAFTALGRTQQLTAGHLLYLAPKERHSVRCIDDASFLLTLVLGR